MPNLNSMVLITYCYLQSNFGKDIARKNFLKKNEK